jgi:CBS domain-containing membrane protein
MPLTKLRHGWRIFKPNLAGASLRDRLLACVGALAGVVVTGFICSFASSRIFVPLLVAPIGASAVLLFAIPASPLAQPWSIIGGNALSALVGVIVAHLGMPTTVAAGTAVAGAILTMSIFRCMHPPGGAAALTAVMGGPAVIAAGWAFPLLPVAINSIALVAAGFAYHRFSGHSYPHRPVPVAGHTLAVSRPQLHMEDLDLALADLGETFDISREDLELLFRQMEFHAAARSH